LRVGLVADTINGIATNSKGDRAQAIKALLSLIPEGSLDAWHSLHPLAHR